MSFETIITVVAIVLLVVFSKPLFTLAGGLVVMFFGSIAMVAIFFVVKALLFGV